MKYWRGYLVAAIVAACSWGLTVFAKAHWELVDMVYPYVSRLIQNFMAGWSADVPFCLWQMCILVMIAGVLASIVMMIIWKWNPIQWFGWVLTAVSAVVLLHTGLYGLNQYAGPLHEDIRLEISSYTVPELQDAAKFYQDKANALAQQVSRDSTGQPDFADFQTLAEQSGDGFDVLTYEQYNSVFAGSRLPVKELGWSNHFTKKGVTYLYAPITGEAAVNPQTPEIGMPFAMCQVMAKRACIANEQDAAFAAFLACTENPSVEFQYSGYFMAYRYCYNALSILEISSAQNSTRQLLQMESQLLKRDLESYNSSFAVGSDHAYTDVEKKSAEKERVQTSDIATSVEQKKLVRSNVADLLVCWHLQQYVLPLQQEEEVKFDPLDESQVDLSGIANAKTDE